MHLEILFMAYTSLGALLILLIAEHELSKQFFAYGWNFFVHPISTVRRGPRKTKAQVDDGDSEESSVNEMMDERDASCYSCKPKKNQNAVTMKKVSKYCGRRLAVNQMTLNIQP